MAVYVICLLSGAGVDLLVMVGVCELVDVFVVLSASSSVSGGRCGTVERLLLNVCGSTYDLSSSSSSVYVKVLGDIIQTAVL